jgi:predicted helicase
MGKIRSQIAERQIERKYLINEKKDQRASESFDKFLGGLQKNINPSINEEEAIEMLAQHIITNQYLKHYLKVIPL